MQKKKKKSETLRQSYEWCKSATNVYLALFKELQNEHRLSHWGAKVVPCVYSAWFVCGEPVDGIGTDSVLVSTKHPCDVCSQMLEVSG